MNTSYVERHLFDAGGHTGNTYYIRIIHRGTSCIWNPITEIMEEEADITWDESADELVEEGLTGVFPIIIQQDWRTVEEIALDLYSRQLVNLSDAEKSVVGTIHQNISNLPAGVYDVVVYNQEDSVPVNSDDVEKQFEIKVGSIFGF